MQLLKSFFWWGAWELHFLVFPMDQSFGCRYSSTWGLYIYLFIYCSIFITIYIYILNIYLFPWNKAKYTNICLKFSKSLNRFKFFLTVVYEIMYDQKIWYIKNGQNLKLHRCSKLNNFLPRMQHWEWKVHINHWTCNKYSWKTQHV